ncbi:translation initiation factor IF-3 [Marispirochaeta aestuarii]|uniref:translation initiation factor IF-3 n=1 Tax=Marispirochaeta aestuarii TaxID=1963862 RepID=UPI0029C8AE26|nr:translation initiation factor IF-3 [Marispirochaeta aestuarii]
MAVKDLRINEQIRVREVRLIDGDGEQRGVLPVNEAIQLAQDAGLDLVEIAPNANPPVCKILDYGKYKFDQEKRNRESKKKQKLLKMKEIRMQPKIEKHDMEFKAKHIRDFLEDGNKVKVTIRFRGRELAHTELGRVVLEKIMELLGDSFVIDRPPAMEGRFMSMILNPKASIKAKQKKSKESDTKEETADAKDEDA